MYQVKCVKCGKPYESEDQDDYYCLVCLEEKKRLAQEIDKQISARPKKQPISDLQKYDSLPKIGGFPNANHFL